jgi:hypothetical protein
VENKSLVKSLAVLKALMTRPRPLSAAQLCPQLTLTRPTVYCILGILSRHGHVTRQSDGPLYRPSVKLLEIAQQVLERTDRPASADPLHGAGQSRLGAPAGGPDPERPALARLPTRTPRTIVTAPPWSRRSPVSCGKATLSTR